jgi:hypothetical protein
VIAAQPPGAYGAHRGSTERIAKTELQQSLFAELFGFGGAKNHVEIFVETFV